MQFVRHVQGAAAEPVLLTLMMLSLDDNRVVFSSTFLSLFTLVKRKF